VRGGEDRVLRGVTRNTILAATHLGVYRTTDGGANWAPYGNGLPTVRVSDIYMPPDGSFTRIATYGRGVWELGQLELVNASLTDDVTSCDHDGAVDNGEVGTLRVTLVNQGANNVNQGTVTFSSTNPHVTFPNGAVIGAPSIGPKGTGVASIAVAVNGAVGIETSDFTVALDVPQLALGSTMNVQTTHRVNYDEVANSSATETVEGSVAGWTASGAPLDGPNVNRWQVRALSPTRHVFWGPDNNGQRDDSGPPPKTVDAVDEQTLTSPPFTIGTDPITISFSHRFAFEAGPSDGGIVEISTDGGASWTDIGTSAYNGTLGPVTAITPVASRPAFVNRNTGWPSFVPVALNLGTAFSNTTAQIRFHIGTDSNTGAPGWDVDDIQITGTASTPFAALVPEASTCP
jgi:hypothetical protein